MLKELLVVIRISTPPLDSNPGSSHEFDLHGQCCCCRVGSNYYYYEPKM